MNSHKLNSVNYYLKPIRLLALLSPLSLPHALPLVTCLSFGPASIIPLIIGYSQRRPHYTNQFCSDVNNALTMQTFFMFPILMPIHNMFNLFVVLVQFSLSSRYSYSTICAYSWCQAFMLTLFNLNDTNVISVPLFHPLLSPPLFSPYKNIYLKCVAFPMHVPPFWHSPLWHGSTSVWQFLPVYPVI